MADLGAVRIRALIDETDIGKVRPGMPARVTVAAYPNQPFEGEVTKIEPQAVVEQNVTMFSVLISIQNPEGLLLPGMNAEVEISVASRDDVLTVPVIALRTERDIAVTAGILGMSEATLRNSLGVGEQGLGRRVSRGEGRNRGSSGPDTPDYRFGGHFWVVVDRGGDTEIVKVRAGLTDLDRVEIISGLDEADKVLLLPSAHLVETQERLQQRILRRVGTVPGINRQ
jgi:HlyD family secretion protein